MECVGCRSDYSKYKQLRSLHSISAASPWFCLLQQLLPDCVRLWSHTHGTKYSKYNRFSSCSLIVRLLRVAWTSCGWSFVQTRPPGLWWHLDAVRLLLFEFLTWQNTFLKYLTSLLWPLSINDETLNLDKRVTSTVLILKVRYPTIS